MADIAVLTTDEKRNLRDYVPALSDRTPGIDLAAQLDEIIGQANSANAAATVNTTALGKLYSGKTTISNADNTGFVSVDAGTDLSGKQILATKGTLTGGPSASYISKAEHGAGGDAGKIKVTLSAATGVGKTVLIHWMVDAR